MEEKRVNAESSPSCYVSFYRWAVYRLVAWLFPTISNRCNVYGFFALLFFLNATSANVYRGGKSVKDIGSSYTSDKVERLVTVKLYSNKIVAIIKTRILVYSFFKLLKLLKLNFANIREFLKISFRPVDHSRRYRYPNVGEKLYTRVKLSIVTNYARHVKRIILISVLCEFRFWARFASREEWRYTLLECNNCVYTRRCRYSLEIGGQWKSILRCWYDERFDTAITRKLYYNTLVTTRQRNRVLKVKICYFQRTIGIFSNEVRSISHFFYDDSVEFEKFERAQNQGT